jgi:hypothetical protein
MSWTNETCSLRIQLAYDGREIPFHTLQNLVAIWAIYEDVVRCYSQIITTATTFLAVSLSTRFPVSADKETYRTAIYHCKTLPELRDLAGLYATWGGRTKINLLTFLRTLDLDTDCNCKPTRLSSESTWVPSMQTISNGGCCSLRRC